MMETVSRWTIRRATERHCAGGSAEDGEAAGAVGSVVIVELEMDGQAQDRAVDRKVVPDSAEADFGDGDVSPVPTDVLEILASQAALAFENSIYKRRAGGGTGS